jgi:hypothetical protein
MAALRRVFGKQAGPTAIGILVPPGRRTVVLVRPRALPWDLLPIEPDDDASAIRFRNLARDEAESLAEALGRALDNWSTDTDGRAEAVPAPGAPGHCVRVEFGRFRLIVCPRLPGQSYRPMVWAVAEHAIDAARVLRDVLCPPPGARQEVYFNSHHFLR